MNLAQFLEIKVKNHPERAAIIFEGGTISFDELNKNANRVANGLRGLGIEEGDRVAIMLPNIPEFVYAFLACQKLGAVAVPFNTMYKGGEISYILKDCCAKAIITLSNTVPLINEIKPDLPHLEHIIITGDRNLTFADPDGTLFLQGVFSKGIFKNLDDAYQRIADILTQAFIELGLKDIWYKHRGSLRIGEKKIAGFTFSEVEDIYIFNIICFVSPFDPTDFFPVIGVPPEVKNKIFEPLTSVQAEIGRRPGNHEVENAILEALEKGFGVSFKEEGLTENERLGYEKYKALAKNLPNP